MIIWHIEGNGREVEIEVGPLTVLKGSHQKWFTLVRKINDFFNEKKSDVQIYEDTQLLHKQDWECIFIPFDASLELDKINTKSPLKILLDEMSDELTMIPSYYELISIWEELIEEVQFISHKLKRFDLKLDLANFELDFLKKHLTFQSMNQLMTPIEYKKLILQLCAERGMDKKRIIIVELPELYASKKELANFIGMVHDLLEVGTRFIIVTNSIAQVGNRNYIFNGRIINNAILENMKQIILSELPFYCQDAIYREVQQMVIDHVDKYGDGTLENAFTHNYQESVIAVLYVISKNLSIDLNLDLSKVSPNISKFLSSYS
ncbi:hypothetical protein [Bacillus niameyensis]|uniref:hypothetical protein n=1 Tax=Bacillus niameyensis TaxID=1522308 RepID=UPI000783679C|nr:hypothetical protein [Bacillus niameyensis]